MTFHEVMDNLCLGMGQLSTWE
jgi:hypothetical protein